MAAVRSVEFSPDGQQLVTASDDKTVLHLELPYVHAHRFEHEGAPSRPVGGCLSLVAETNDKSVLHSCPNLIPAREPPRTAAADKAVPQPNPNHSCNPNRDALDLKSHA